MSKGIYRRVHKQPYSDMPDHVETILMKLTREELRLSYNAVCNAYLAAFCEKHGYDYEPDAGMSAAILLPVAISYSFAWWGWVLTVVGILFAGWICYGISWLIEVIIPPYPGAYYYTCFETEAYNHEDDPDYLKRRIPLWGWISCIPNRKVKHKR